MNVKIFEDREISPFSCVVQGLNILGSYCHSKPTKMPRVVQEEIIDKREAYVYFDEASQREPLVGGVRESSTYLIYSLHLKANIGQGSNNFL